MNRSTNIMILPVVILLTLSAATRCAASSSMQPNLARGTASGKVLEYGEWDSVNLLNGNLNVPITLGINYPLTQNFGYQFALNYNSNIWDLMDGSAVSAAPTKYSNAGVGWDLSFGRLVDPFAPDNPLKTWIFISADGAWHPFYSTLHFDVYEADDNVFYTRDGTYYRLKQLSGKSCTVESPDGTIRTFEFAGNEWRITKVADRFNNHLSISYASANAWTITDNHGRIHTVYFKGDAAGYYPRVIDRIVLASFGGGSATYTFTYTTETITRPAIDKDPATSPTVNVPLLASVNSPDGSRRSFTYHPAGAANDASGRMASMQLPTLGQIEWDYQIYSFTTPGRPTSLRWIYSRNSGLAERRLINKDGTTLGAWTYTPSLNPTSTEEREMTNVVKTPLGDKTTYYFSVNTQGTGTGWNRSDYGLPLTKNETDATGGRYLSSRVFDCDGAGNNCQPMRSLYVRYEQEGSTDPASPEVGNTNRREATRRIVYHDDVENGVARFADIDRSAFDGLGHYRQTNTNGNFGSRDVRQTFVNFNPLRGTYPSASFVTPGSDEPWVLNTFSQRRTTEGQSIQVADFCFDVNTGFLKRQRNWKSNSVGGAAGANDVVSVNTLDSAGQVSKEQFYGGDVQTLSTSSLCSLALPSDQYRVSHTYQYGVLSSSQYLDGTDQPVGPKYVDLTNDKNTGLKTTSRDSAGLATQYEYDSLGRETFIKPASGHGAWTQYRYNAAADSGNASKITHRLPNGGGSPITYYAEVSDDFGRVRWEQKAMPSGTNPNLYRHYSAMGWLTHESEFSVGDPKYTEYLHYDPFGRVKTVRPPDGTQHDTTFEYAGIRSVKKTANVAISYTRSTGQINEEPRSTTTVYDRQGQVWKTIVTSKDYFGAWRDDTTVNYYDLAGRFLESQRNGTRIGSVYSFDGRGFLVSTYSEDSRETNSSLNNDALGNALRSRRFNHVQQSTVELTNVYDRAERLTAIADPNNSSKLWKEFIYATSNGTNDWKAGKLWQTKRYNDMSRFLSGVGVAVVTETFTYGGTEGKVSQYSVELSDQLGRHEKFAQTYTYNDLGDVTEHSYPNDVAGSNIDLGRERKVLNGYSQGKLTSVGGSFNSQSESWANSIGYHANGLINQVVHSNGVTDNIATDPSGITRVGSVSTSGARNKFTGNSDNLNSGNFQYDGKGSIVRIGDQYFVREAGYQPPAPSPPPASGIDPCGTGYFDPLGSIYAAADAKCNVKNFYYFTASEQLFKAEDGIQQEKVWYFWDLLGRPLTQYATGHTHYQPWPGQWKNTRDFIYRDGLLIAIDEKRNGEPATLSHYHVGHGSAGMLTDKNGIRIQD